ncbi:MAG: transporter [Deltaproteobacteria bacterium]|nr:transporter [Deltaproteobacteria bacterium]
MVEVTLMAISCMWFPVGLTLIGKGDAFVTGAVTFLVGILTIIGAILQVVIFKDAWVAGLLMPYGFFYCSVGYALNKGAEDMRGVGNVSLTVAFVTVVYLLVSLFGGPVLPDGKQLVGPSGFLALACAGYLVLYIMVWLNAFGKFSGKTLGYSLLVWTVVGLWLPAFSLLLKGALPF